MIEVHFGNRPGFLTLDIYILDRDQINGKMYLLQFGKNKTDMMEIHPYAAEIAEPTFRLAHDKGNEFLKAIADAAAQRGIKTDPDLKREGRLEALEAHLADMRRLVFKQDATEESRSSLNALLDEQVEKI